ncbi:MAG: hypothetical protein KC646_01705 [Candidatus Cloacimonetes bacterium]|nr:hypothetical protein [Candidatus Cloacimonadota bacterium]
MFPTLNGQGPNESILQEYLELISDIFLDHNLIQSNHIYSRLHNASIIFEVDDFLLLEIWSCNSKSNLHSYELRLLEKKYTNSKRKVIFEVRLPIRLEQFIEPKEYEPICHLFHNRIQEYYDLCPQ